MNKVISLQNVKENKNSFLIAASIIAALNILFATNYLLSTLFVFVQLIILGYLFLKKKITHFFCYYLIFLSLSFEFEEFFGGLIIYGFKNFRVLGFSLGILCLIPIPFLVFLKKNKWLKVKHYSIHLYKFSAVFLMMTISGVFFGLLSLLINDNNIMSFNNPLFLFIGRLYELMLFPVLILLCFLYIVVNENEKLYMIKDALIAILFASVVSLITSILSGMYGAYGGVQTLLAPLVTSYIPFLIIFFFYNEKIKSEGLLKVSYFIGVILLVANNASGKLIILIILMPIIVLLVTKRQKNYRTFILLVFLVPLILILGTFLMGRTFNNVLLSSKMHEAISLMNIFGENWLINMPASPKFRVLEFINIFYEYLEKPWFFLFGKGYNGTIKDHIGMFEYSLGAFPQEQWNHGIFSYMHASINTLFLTHGLLGLGLYIYVIKISYQKLVKSHWGVIGAYWFLIYYGYSLTLSGFGFVALLLALYDVGSNKKIKEVQNA